MQSAETLDIGEVPDRVTVSCTATLRGVGLQRLPDRLDAQGAVAAFLVESDDLARQLFRDLDRAGRTVFVDVERKQQIDLMALACAEIQEARIQPHKPNDATVRSLDVLVSHQLGHQLADTRVGVFGTGNLAVKSALLLAERGAGVFIHGRSADRVARTIEAINGILPAFNVDEVRPWRAERVHLMVTAVAARGVVEPRWLDRLHPSACVVDVGIGNLAPEFIQGAISLGHEVLRLDTRTSGNQVSEAAPGFFERCFGRATLGGVAVVSGGIVGPRGTIVVDSYAEPTTIFGVADGVGGLVAPSNMDSTERDGVSRVKAFLRTHETAN